MDKVKVLVIAGTTGTGKSELAVRLAKKFNGEVISGDSMQVYRGMDIGTAKITKEEMQDIPHHLIDEQDPGIPYDVRRFQQRAREEIADISRRGKLPIICGGTGLYLKAALYDYEFEAEADNTQLKKELEKKSSEELWDQLQAIDRESAEKIHPNNRKRVIRALLVSQSGMTKSEREKAQEHQPLYDVLWIGLDRPANEDRLKARIDKMMADGLEDEVKKIFSDPASWNWTSFQGIGYKEWRPVLEGQGDPGQTAQQILIHTRQYARRQRTWFRRQLPMHWHDPDRRDEIEQEVSQWLKTPCSEAGCF